MKKFVSALTRFIFGFVCFALSLVFVVFVGEKLFYGYFFTNANAEFAIPGLWTNFVPQGFDKLDDGSYLISGYDKSDDAPSSLYIVDENERKRVDLYNADGSDYVSHAGGVTHFKDFVYVAYNTGEEITYCDMFLLSDVLDGDGKAVKADTVPLPNRISYCSVYGNRLYAGAFYREGSQYLTPENHQLTTPAGDKNTALMMVYELDERTGKPTSDKPELVYSTISNVQGMCFTDSGKIVLSTSWSIYPSELFVYDVETASKGEWDYNGTSVPLVYLDGACLESSVVCPPMSEELVYQDGRVFILTESACMKYLYGKLTSGNFLYSIPLE
ncbi:MAG: hypothetical protein IJW60_02445 [Clostridia bacterium]|nr:hypothetical protein [Clostridia bacterium]